MLTAILALATSAPSSAAEIATCSELRSDTPLLGSSIRLIAEAPEVVAVLDEAIGLWRGCGDAGALPQLVTRGHADRMIRVRFDPGNSASSKCGSFGGSTITLFGSALSGSRRPVRCGDLARNLAHEIGHAFGLLDSPKSPRCRSTIMAKLDPGNGLHRIVSPTECSLVDRRWQTAWELEIGLQRPAPGGARSHQESSPTRTRRIDK